MITYDAEAIKQIDLVSFLNHYYQMEFKRCGGGFTSLSPFTHEQTASFTVRYVDGHWLFKDFSSGLSGSCIDFVIEKESLSDAHEGIHFINKLLSGPPTPNTLESPTIEQSNKTDTVNTSSYDISYLLEQMCTNDLTKVREYLAKRCIDTWLIDKLCDMGLVVHNYHRKKSYCCFVVYNPNGELCCLDNHQIDGDAKFVLGKKHCFSLDWQDLPDEESGFVCEGIIDYLSMKCLEGDELKGIALLGKEISAINPQWYKSAWLIMSALDTDDAGIGSVFDLSTYFDTQEISCYELDNCKDPNEYLQFLRGGGKIRKTKTAQEKRQIYEEYIKAENKSLVARKWGINRSYMYEIIEECKKLIEDGFNNRRPGRPSTPVTSSKPGTLDEAIEHIAQMQARYESLAKEKELLYAAHEFAKVRLKWSEIENVELRGIKGDTDTPTAPRKKQIKKKKKKRR